MNKAIGQHRVERKLGEEWLLTQTSLSPENSARIMVKKYSKYAKTEPAQLRKQLGFKPNGDMEVTG